MIKFLPGSSRGKESVDKPITDDLKRSRISSIDSPTKKLLCKNRRHFGLSIVTSVGHRKLYFLTYEQMVKSVDYILLAQKYKKRIDQYKFIEQLPNNEVSDRKLVKHRQSGDKFILKQIPKTAIEQIKELAMTELKALQTCKQSKSYLGLIDYFEDESNIYLVTEYSKQSLRQFAKVSAESRFSEEQAGVIVSKIAKAIGKLHDSFIVHRDIRLDTIAVKVKKTRVKV